MSIKFTDRTMTCGASGHTAHQDDAGTWSVSWLPGRALGRNAAITALSIAEATAKITGDAGMYDRLWPHIAGWAAELGLRTVDAVEAAARARAWTVDAVEGTAVGPSVPVVAGGAVLAVLRLFWSDEDGVRVRLDSEEASDDMTTAQALALSEALRTVAATEGPTA